MSVKIAHKPTCMNLDCIPPVQLKELTCISGMLTLMQSNYAKTKLLAMAHRNSGDIVRARYWEALCEVIYQNMPQNVKW